MDSCAAWMTQAIADRDAAERERVAEKESGSRVRCHAVAKYQQSVEKMVKAVVAAAVEAGILTVAIGYKHEVQKWAPVLIRLSDAPRGLKVRKHLHRLFDQDTRNGIAVLESLIPKRRPDGRPRRNTEYPFQDDAGGWACPASPDVFSPAEVDHFRRLSDRIIRVGAGVVSALRRGGK